MKILSYNIHHCSQAKIDTVLSKGADILVLPEFACLVLVNVLKDYEMIWLGV